MMAFVVSWLARPFGRVIVGAVAALAAWGFVKFHYESKGAQKVRAKYVAAGAKNAKKAKRVRAKVRKSRVVRDHYFRD